MTRFHRAMPISFLVFFALGCANAEVDPYEPLDSFDVPTAGGAADELDDYRRLDLRMTGTITLEEGTNTSFDMEMSHWREALEIRAPLLLVPAEDDIGEAIRTYTATSDYLLGLGAAVEFLPGTWDGKKFRRYETTVGELGPTLPDDVRSELDLDEDELLRSWSKIGFAPAAHQMLFGTELPGQEAPVWVTVNRPLPSSAVSLALFPVIASTLPLDGLEGEYHVVCFGDREQKFER